MKIESKKRTAKIAIFGVGLDTYWNQFDGLLDELNGYMDDFQKIVLENGVEIKNFGMVDNASAAYKTLEEMKEYNPDLIFCDMLTYATSATFGIIIREMTCPIVLAILQPQAAMDYENAKTYIQLCNDNICAVPEFAGVAIRMGKKVPPMIIGKLYDEKIKPEIAHWCDVAKALNSVRGARIGMMGHVLEAMLDMHSDPTAFTAQLGLHIVQCEPDGVVKCYENADPVLVSEKKKLILSFFDTPDPKSDPLTEKLTDEHLETAARVSVALDEYIGEKKLDGMAYYYEGIEDTLIRKVVTNFIVGNSLLCASGFPMCGELDLKTCVAMLIMDSVGMGGSFAELHPIDFNEGFVLVGHDGPHHLKIAEGKPVIRSLKKYHGKPGSGASVEFKIKEGPITMMSMGIQANGKFKMIIAEGESMKGAIPPTGNTNTRGFFKPDAPTFLKKWFAEGPTHHFALGIGHKAQLLKDIADALGIDAVIVE